MSTTKSVQRSLVSLDLPKKVPALISYATSVVTAMTGNPSFPTPAPTLAEVTAAITALQTAESAAIARTKGAVTARNDKQAALVSLLQEMKAYIQKTADADAENSAAVIQSAGVSVKKTPVRKPRVFNAEQGATSGTAKLVTASAGNRASYEWQYSVDGGKTWVAALATLQAKTSVTGLTPGSTVQFRYLAVTKTGQGDWSPAVSLLVK
jgi:cell pole-organizing protein PopZ